MSRPWFAFYPGDYARDTANLSLVEDGAYRRLLDYCYCTAEPLPLDVDRSFRICRASTPEEQAAVRFVLGEFFVKQSDGFHNPRADREILKQFEYKNKLSESGRKGAAIRWAEIPAKAPDAAEPQPPKPRKPKQVSGIDSRHRPVCEFILSLHAKTFPAAPACPWDGRTGTVLKRVLKANESWTVEQIQKMVENRFKSEGVAPDAEFVNGSPNLAVMQQGRSTNSNA